jgi:hypothetical protein
MKTEHVRNSHRQGVTGETDFRELSMTTPRVKGMLAWAMNSL